MTTSTIIISALISGIAQGATEASIGAAPRAYAHLKRLLSDKYGINLSALERNPQSEIQQSALNEELSESGALRDPEVIGAANSLVQHLGINFDNQNTSDSIYAPNTHILGSRNRVDNRQTNTDNRQTNIDSSQNTYNKISRNPLLAILGLIILCGLAYFVLRFLGGGNSLPPKPPYFGVFAIGENSYLEATTTRGNPDPGMSFPKVSESQPSVALYLAQPGDYNMLMLQPLEHANENRNNPYAVPYNLSVDENDVVVARFGTPVVDGVYCFIQGDWMGVPDRLTRYCFEVDAE